MNSGFSNLTFLKGQLLAQTLKNDPRFNDAIQTIGLGVASQFEEYCGRKFGYVVGQQDVFSADRTEFLLSRYPVVLPITLVEYKHSEAKGWVTQLQSGPDDITDDEHRVIKTVDAQAGCIYFDDDQDLGEYFAQMRFTYNGGYYFETLDPNDPGYVDPKSSAYAATIPTGVCPLPNALRLAWLLQCRKIWEAIDKTGANVLQVGSNARQVAEVLAGLDLVPEVKISLSSFVRYNFV